MHLTSKKKPKVKTTFSIPEDCYLSLAKFADASGVSRSQIITEVLQFVSPILDQLTLAIESGDEDQIEKISQDFTDSLDSLKRSL